MEAARVALAQYAYALRPEIGLRGVIAGVYGAVNFPSCLSRCPFRWSFDTGGYRSALAGKGAKPSLERNHVAVNNRPFWAFDNSGRDESTS